MSKLSIPHRLILIGLVSIVLFFFLAYPRISFEGDDEEVKGLLLPATGVWNGNNSHLIVLECGNLKQQGVTLELIVKNQSNTIIGAEDFRLSGKQSAHIILNKYEIRDGYGTFDLNLKEGSDPAVSCQTITYRMDAKSKVQYATASNIGEVLQGNSSGVFNSMNPDQTVSNPVYNWLSIYNPGTDSFSAMVRVRDQSGAPLPDRNIRVESVPPGGRQDFALGHPDGQVVGVYEIIPDNDMGLYGAFLSRYSETAPGEFSFSMIIPASQGVTDSGMVPASTMGPAFNWAELANISSHTVSAELEVFDRNGISLYKTEKILQGYAQYHEFLNRHIGELNVGFFRVKSSAPLLVQSFYYGRDEVSPESVFWAYNTVANGKFYRDVSFGVNTNLNAPNWVKIFSANESGDPAVRVSLALFDNQGQEIALGDKKYIDVLGSVDIPVHEFAGSDFTGTLYLKTLSENAKIQAQLVRVFVVKEGRERTSAMRVKSMREISGRSSGGSLIGAILPVSGQVTRSVSRISFFASSGGGGGSGGKPIGWPNLYPDPDEEENVPLPCSTDSKDCPDISDNREVQDKLEKIPEYLDSSDFGIRTGARQDLENLILDLISENPNCSWKIILDEILTDLKNRLPFELEHKDSYEHTKKVLEVKYCGPDPYRSCCNEENPCGCNKPNEDCRYDLNKRKSVCCSGSPCGRDNICGCPDEIPDPDKPYEKIERECRKGVIEVEGAPVKNLTLCCPVKETPCGKWICGCPQSEDCRTMRDGRDDCCPEDWGPEPCGSEDCGCRKNFECIFGECVKTEFDEPVENPTFDDLFRDNP